MLRLRVGAGWNGGGRGHITFHGHGSASRDFLLRRRQEIRRRLEGLLAAPPPRDPSPPAPRGSHPLEGRGKRLPEASGGAGEGRVAAGELGGERRRRGKGERRGERRPPAGNEERRRRRYSNDGDVIEICV
ncbi:unnamed protein product [Urochloa humidicola]